MTNEPPQKKQKNKKKQKSKKKNKKLSITGVGIIIIILYFSLGLTTIIWNEIMIDGIIITYDILIIVYYL